MEQAQPVAPGTPLLDGEQRERLNQIQKLLVGVTSPDIAAVAAGAGYTSAEHAAGRALYDVASGADRPFQHALAHATLVPPAPEPSPERYRTIDDFENLWFPQLRNLFGRYLADADPRATAFWQDLAQQPLGAAVVGSVGTFLARLTGLEADASPEVTAIFERLRERGLTPELRAETEVALAGFKTLPAALPAPVTVPDAAELAAADQRQRDAYPKVNAWYIDVADNLRGKLGYHARIKLGISDVKRAPPAPPEPPKPPT